MIIAHWGESHLVNVQCKHMNRWYHRLSYSRLLAKIRTCWRKIYPTENMSTICGQHINSRIDMFPGFLNSVDFRADGGMIYCLYFVMLTLCGDYTLLNGKANMKSLFNLGRNNCRWERTIKTFKREIRGNVSVRSWLTVYENLCKTETGLIGSFHDESFQA